MVMENRPVDPGSIQGSHRPISFITPLVMASKSSLEKFYPGTFVGNFLMYARYWRKSTLKSLETFAFAKNRPIRRESLETFDPSKVVDESTPAEIIPVRV